jgi:hypothetical protein
MDGQLPDAGSGMNVTTPSVRRSLLATVFWCGCTQSGVDVGEDPEIVETPVSLDDTTMGFSAADVLAHVGDRSYPHPTDAHSPQSTADERLAAASPWSVHAPTDPAAVLRTIEGERSDGSTRLFIRGSVRVRSGDGAFDFQGPLSLSATGLDDGSIEWVTEAGGAVGLVPEWVDALRTDQMVVAACPIDAEPSAELTLARSLDRAELSLYFGSDPSGTCSLSVNAAAIRLVGP